jgi:myo-inositol-1(or 4)-monophosphatase
MSGPDSSSDGAPRLASAARLARAGGQIALEHWSRAQVSWKTDDSMVTDSDLAVQVYLDREIAAAFPDDGVLGEESGASRPACCATGVRSAARWTTR